MFYYDIKDDQYPNNGFTHTRNTVRAIIVNDKDEVIMLQIKGEDDFGKRNHLETPGGGVEKGESFEAALIRELEEELGYKCHIESYLGMIVSRYNLLKRITVSRFYVCSLVSKSKTSRTDFENTIIDAVITLPLDQCIQQLQKANNKVDKLVHKRELLALRAFKTQYNK